MPTKVGSSRAKDSQAASHRARASSTTTEARERFTEYPTPPEQAVPTMDSRRRDCRPFERRCSCNRISSTNLTLCRIISESIRHLEATRKRIEATRWGTFNVSIKGRPRGCMCIQFAVIKTSATTEDGFRCLSLCHRSLPWPWDCRARNRRLQAKCINRSATQTTTTNRFPIFLRYLSTIRPNWIVDPLQHRAPTKKGSRTGWAAVR